MMKAVIIQLDTQKAEMFKQFCKHQEQFKILLEEGVFDSYVGSKTIHKNGEKIQIIESKNVKRIHDERRIN